MPRAGESTHIAEESQPNIGSQIGIEPMPHNASFNQRGTPTAAENGMIDSYSQLIRELDKKDLEIRKLSKAQETLGRLQDEVLFSVDRFQPTFDADIIKALQGLESKARPLISFLAKLSTKFPPDKWELNIVPFMWVDSVNTAGGLLDFSKKEIRRKVLKNVLWTFLEQNLFQRPFMCFGGPLTDHLDGLYKALYPDPHENDASAKWRAMTVQQLKAQDVEKFNADVQSHLFKEFELMLRELGYEVNETELRKKTNDVLIQAISFAQLVAGQRAIFGFYVPKRKGSGMQTKKDDELMTNIDGEFPEVLEEISRDVWFVVKPGLAKWGTGTGENLDKSTILVKSYIEVVN